VAGFLVVRVLRRAVIVSPFGLEARRMFITWRLPWSAVEAFAVKGAPELARGEGALTVVLVDGSTRSVHVGSRRHGHRDFAEVAAAARRHPLVRQRGYLGPNWPIVLFILGGLALMVACLVADIGRAEHRKLAALRTTTAKQLDDLQTQIAIGDAFAVALYVVVVITAVIAVVWSRRERGVAPTGPWPAKLRFPDDVPGTPTPPAMPSPSGDEERSVGSWLPPRVPCRPNCPLDIPPVVICQDDGVFDPDGALVAAISHRKVAWTEIDHYTYWSARGVADFSVQVQPPHVVLGGGALMSGTRWRLAAWDEPLQAHAEVTVDQSGLVLQGAGVADCRLKLATTTRSHYAVIDETGRTLATMEQAFPGWKCRMSSDLPLATRRLVCVAALWAEQRARADSSS
jgi:hypothetical protein